MFLGGGAFLLRVHRTRTFAALFCFSCFPGQFALFWVGSYIPPPPITDSLRFPTDAEYLIGNGHRDTVASRFAESKRGRRRCQHATGHVTDDANLSRRRFGVDLGFIALPSARK